MLAVDAHAVGAVLDGAQSALHVIDALFRTCLEAKVVFAHLRIGRGFRGMMMPVGALVAVCREVVFALQLKELRLQVLKALFRAA